MVFTAALLISLSSLYSMSKSDYYSISAYAADPNKIDFLKGALENGADPNQFPKYNMTPLQIAISKNNIDAIKLLLKYGAHINCIADDAKLGPLAMACYLNKKEALLLFLQKDADPNSYADQMFNPLLYTQQNVFFTNIFFIYGANPYKKDRYGDTAISFLEKASRFKQADYLKEKYIKLFELLVKLLHRGTVAGGIKLPLDMARLITSYCYPQEEKVVLK